MKADLHTHSELSDGYFSIKDLIDYGVLAGLDYMAITDHDTVSGLIEAVSYGKRVGMKIIPGLEFSTRNYENGKPVHILCYYPGDLFAYQEFLDHTLELRTHYKQRTIKKLAKDFPVTEEEMLKSARNSDSIYNSHIMLPFWEKGFTPSIIGDFFKKEAGNKSHRYEKIPYPNIYDVLTFIEETGGIAVVAHPGEYGSLGITEKLAKEGRIQGIELHHPRNTKADQKEILRIASEYGLFLTGGTDYHGPSTSSVHPLGTYLCPEDGLQALLDLNPRKTL